MLRPMTAKELSPEQKAEAARLKLAFHEWQQARKLRGEDWTQAAATEALGFTQSALSQYINGIIPLNMDAVLKFSVLLGKPAARISPLVCAQVQAEQQRAAAFLAGSDPTREHPHSRRGADVRRPGSLGPSIGKPRAVKSKTGGS